MTGTGELWTEEQDAVLKRLLAEGHKMSLIAAEIGGGKTKNAVIARAHRLGINRGHFRPVVSLADRARKTPAVAHGGKRTARKVVPKKAPLTTPRHVTKPIPAPMAVAPSVRGWPKPKTETAVTIFDLTRTTCRMPLFDGHEPIDRQFYCGAPSPVAAPYCPACRTLTFEPKQSRSPARAA